MILIKKTNPKICYLSKREAYNRLNKVVSLPYCIELLKKDLLRGWVSYDAHKRNKLYIPDPLVKNPEQKSQILFVLGFFMNALNRTCLQKFIKHDKTPYLCHEFFN